MDRDIPVFNRPIMSKIQKRNLESHLNRLRNIKCGSNRTMLAQGNHTLSNRKAVMVEEQKKTEIEKQNMLLFNKMRKIMKRSDPNNQPRATIPWRNGINLDYQRIEQENRSIFDRLEQQKPTISNKKLYEDRLRNLGILKFLGKYPHVAAEKAYYQSLSLHRQSERKKGNSTSYHRGYGVPYELDEDMYEQDFQNFQKQARKKWKRQNQTGTSSRNRKYMSQVVKRKNQSRERATSNESQRWRAKKPTNTENSPQKMGFHQPEILLYQRQVSINGSKAFVQFYRLYNKYLILARFEKIIPKKYELVIPETEGNQFFSAYNYNYEAISHMLILEDGKLVIDLEQKKNSQGQKEFSTQVKSKAMVGNTNMGQLTKYEQSLDEMIE